MHCGTVLKFQCNDSNGSRPCAKTNKLRNSNSSNHLRLHKADASSFSSKQSSHQTTKSQKATFNILRLGSSSNRSAPHLPQQETQSSTKQLAQRTSILGPEKLLKTGFAQKGLFSTTWREPRRRRTEKTILHSE